MALGWIDRLPRIAVVQASGAAPFARAFRDKADLVPVHAETTATAIKIGAPASWKKARAEVAASHGTVLDVDDDAIADARAIVGRDGIGCEPASAASLAGLRALVADGTIARGRRRRARLDRTRAQGRRLRRELSRERRRVRQPDLARRRSRRGHRPPYRSRVKRFAVSVPATSANLGPGFDTIGLALDLRIRADVECSTSGAEARPRWRFSGSEAPTPRRSARRDAARDAHAVRQRRSNAAAAGDRGREPDPARTRSRRQRSRCRARSRNRRGVARSRTVDRRTRSRTVTVLEGHPDNGVPAIVGGIVVAVAEGEDVVYARFDRAARPARASRRSGFLDADARSARDSARRLSAARCGVQRRPRRAVGRGVRERAVSTCCARRCTTGCTSRIARRFVPGLPEMLALETPGLLGVALSGAGPSVLALDASRAAIAGERMQAIFAKHGVASRVLDLRVIRRRDRSGGVTPRPRAKAVSSMVSVSVGSPAGMCSVANSSFYRYVIRLAEADVATTVARSGQSRRAWRTFRMRTPMRSSAPGDGWRIVPAASYDDWPVLEATPQRLRAAFQTARRLLWANAGPVGISAGEMIDVDSDIDSVLGVLHQAEAGGYSVNVSYVS